jgi:hypothetical protein
MLRSAIGRGGIVHVIAVYIATLRVKRAPSDVCQSPCTVEAAATATNRLGERSEGIGIATGEKAPIDMSALDLNGRTTLLGSQLLDPPFRQGIANSKSASVRVPKTVGLTFAFRVAPTAPTTVPLLYR